MRIRAFILIVLTVGWVLPGGALACPPHTSETDSHSQSAHLDGHEHAYGASHDARGDHSHAAKPATRGNEPGAPLDTPTCCRGDAKGPAVLAPALEGKPRPK